MPHPQTLCILGASARAAAQSAVRAGWPVYAIDLFGDVDLRGTAECCVAGDYPGGLFTAAKLAPPGPWLYTGGLENFPPQLAALAKTRELLGVSDAACVRDLPRLNALLRAAKLPEIVYQEDEHPPTAGAWLLKPRRASGGYRIKSYSGPPYPPGHNREAYWTPALTGQTIGATYLLAGGDWRLLGVCEQLSGTPWTGATGLAYAGSLGPLPPEESVRQALARLGDVLCRLPALRGLIGVDAIVDARGELHVLEVNPRYTASVEVLERASGISALRWHIDACRAGTLPPCEAWHDGAGSVAGKAVLYARGDLMIQENFVRDCLRANAPRPNWPVFGDIPTPASRLSAGQPIVTVFAEGGCADEVRFRLRQLAERTLGQLFPATAQ